MKSDDKKSAENYRAQRQQSDAAKAGIEPISPEERRAWLIENRDLIESAARSGGASTPEEIQDWVSYYENEIHSTPNGTAYDDLNALHILGRVIGEIELACKQKKVPIREGVTFGVTPTFELQASLMPVMLREASIMGLSIPLFVFGNVITKAMAKTLLHLEIDGKPAVDNNAAKAWERLEADPKLVTMWVDIFREFGRNAFPPELSNIQLSKEEHLTRTLLLTSVERFVIAHEYGHHVFKHGQTESSGNASSVFCDEHDADTFGRVICIQTTRNDGAINPFLVSGAGAVLILGALDLVRRANAVLQTGVDAPSPRKTHPPFGERIGIFDALDYLVSDKKSEQNDAAHRRKCMVGILEFIRKKVRPELRNLREAGVRPESLSRIDPGGWLPMIDKD